MFSGRNSGNYERLEGGHGSGRADCWKELDMKEVLCFSGSSHHTHLFFRPRDSNGIRRREYSMYVHAFPLQCVCSLNFSSSSSFY